MRDMAEGSGHEESTSRICVGTVNDTTSSEESEECDPVASMLDVLRVPELSALNRKRKVLSNCGHGGKCQQSSSSSSSEPKTVTPLQRVKDFAGEQLVVSSGKPFCNKCREELKLKSSSIKNHVRSSKHVKEKQKVAK